MRSGHDRKPEPTSGASGTDAACDAVGKRPGERDNPGVTPLRALILEDDELDAALLLRALRRDGYEVTHRRVETAAQMRDALTDEPWDVVLSDYSMPALTVQEALDVMHGLRLDLPFIVVSGSVGEESAVGAMKAGAHDFFLKDRLVRLGAAIRRELAEAHIRGQRRLAEAQLAESERQLRSAVQVRDDFLLVASHELKTPLTPLLLELASAAKLVRNHPGAPAAEGLPLPLQLERKLNKAIGHVERFRMLVDRLLDATRMTSGEFPLCPVPLDLRESALAVVDRLREGIERSGSELQVTAEPVVGFWDAAGVETVITNLLVNAGKYGSGKPIEVVVHRSGDSATLTVKDHGIGIAPEDQARIFGRFERAVSVEHYGGFGVGLWVVKRVIDAHGGSIAVESAVGQGSTFRVSLPLATRFGSRASRPA
jgi:signal transduction histidine kinase